MNEQKTMSGKRGADHLDYGGESSGVLGRVTEEVSTYQEVVWLELPEVLSGDRKLIDS